MSTVLVSVIVPIYNDEKYIEACCDSICAQTYKNLEIIFVDDCSEDRSVSIVEEKMTKDDRIQLIRLESNQSAFTARKRGVERASGDYILFCDADDSISKELCDELLKIQKTADADILHFSTEVIDGGVGTAAVMEALDYFKVYEGELKNENIFKECFVEESYCYNLWDKLFKKKLCKDVFAQFEDWYIPKANDLFMYFFLALKAKTYYGIKTKEKYHYYYGKGDTGKKKIDLTGLSLYNSYSHTLSIMKRLCECEKETGTNNAVEQALGSLNKRLMWECLSVWDKNLPDELKKEGFDSIVNTWESETVAESLFTFFGMETGKIAEKILGTEIFKNATKKSRNVAIFYHRMRHGGVERVISLLIPLYMEMGYKVILITEEKANTEDYYIPIDIKRYVIPEFDMVIRGKESYRNRASMLHKIFENENIDTFCYHAATDPGLFYDLFVSKCFGVKFILSKHELFSQGMVKNFDRTLNDSNVYRLVDKVVVLSEVEKLFWDTMSVNAVYIPNPFNSDIKICEVDKREKKYIVWVSRLDADQKRYQDIVPVMKKVAETIPDAVLKVYGSSETYDDLYKLKRLIAKNGLENNIEYCGYTSDVNEIYRDAKIHLVTSAYESFPMNVYESRIFGVPLVIYDMPYLEMLKGGKGYIAVGQGDTDKAAEVIIDLLSRDDYRERVANEALEAGKHYNHNVVLKEKWRAVFENKLQDSQKKEDSKNDDYAVILKTIAYHSALGCEKAQKDIIELQKLRRETKIYEIKLKTLQEKLQVVLYPYGTIGRNTKKMLNRYEVEVKFAVDKNDSDDGMAVTRIEKLADIDCSQYLFVICSNRGDIYDEIRKNVRKYVPENNIYDLYSDCFE